MSHHDPSSRILETALSPRQVAKLNAEMIEQYWHEQGYTNVYAKVYTEKTRVNGVIVTTYEIESNLVGGMPPKIKPPPKKEEPPPEPEPTTIMGKLAKEICDKHNVTIDQFKSLIRTRDVVAAKRAFCKQAYDMGNSATQIAKFLGRDHTTVLYHLKVTEGEA